jgi:hypothetical protein
MMPCSYVSLSKVQRTLDLDSVVDVALGYSSRRSGWTATLVFDPESGAFVELRSAPPDVRGNSADEAEEVDAEYMASTFGLQPIHLSAVIERPEIWELLNLR